MSNTPTSPTTMTHPSREPATGGPPVIAGYALEERVGSGAMGDVWRAKEHASGRTVALKLVHPGAMTQDAARRFELEVAVTASLDHPNVARLYHSQLNDGQLLYAMEYVDGETLEAWGKKNAGNVNAAVDIMLKVCRAVQHAHQRGVIHRDLKLQNVMVTRKGEPKVVDFGLAKLLVEHGPEAAEALTAHGAILGTPAYMAPEQIEGATVDTRTDVYALGVMCFRLTTGQPPVSTDGKLMAFFARVCNERPKRAREVVPGFDPDLEAVLTRALEVSPSLRYGDAGALADDLERYRRRLPVEARGTGASYLISKALIRYKWRLVAVGASMVAAVAVLATSYAWVVQERDAARVAEAAASRAEALATSRLQASRSFASALVTELPAWVYRGPTEVRVRVVERAAARLADLREEAGSDETLALDYASSLHEVAVTKRELLRAGISISLGRPLSEDLDEVMALYGQYMPSAPAKTAASWRRLSWKARLTQVIVAGRAPEAWEMAKGLAEELRKASPAEPMVLGRTLIRQAWMSGARRTVPELKRLLDEAAAVFASLPKPGERALWLSNVAAQRGWTHRVAGNHHRAATHFREAVALLAEIPPSLRDLKVVRAEALALASLAWTYQNFDLEAALRVSARAVALRDLEAAADRTNLTAQRESGWIRVRRGVALALAGRPRESLDTCAAAARVLDPIVDTRSFRTIRDASAAWTIHAAVLAEQGLFKAARRSIHKAQAVLERTLLAQRKARLYQQAASTTAWNAALIAVEGGQADAMTRLDELDERFTAYAAHQDSAGVLRARAGAKLLRARWLWHAEHPSEALAALTAAAATKPTNEADGNHPFVATAIELQRSQWQPGTLTAATFAGIQASLPAVSGSNPDAIALHLWAHRLWAEQGADISERRRRAREALEEVPASRPNAFTGRLHRAILVTLVKTGTPPSATDLGEIRRNAMAKELLSPPAAVRD